MAGGQRLVQAAHRRRHGRVVDHLGSGLGLPRDLDHRIAEGIEGHTQILALFDRSRGEGYTGLDTKKSTVDHIAFGISKSDYESEKKRLQELGFEVRTAEHAWVKWRSLYVNDPDGNNVELVCFDESVK